MYCKSCGNQLPDGSVQCHYCGAQQLPQVQNKSPYETGETPVAFNPPPVVPPQPAGEPEKKGTKGILIGVIVALVVALLAVLFIFVIKPKIDEKKDPNSTEATANTTIAPVLETTTASSANTDETRTGNAEKTTKRDSATNKEKTSKKSESEKTNTNNKVDNGDKVVDDNNAITLPPEIDTNTQQTKLEEAYVILDDILYTIEWGSDAELNKLLKTEGGLVYSDPGDKFMADIVKSTVPYFTYEIWAYEEIDENTYDFFIDIYTVDFYSVADAFVNEYLAYVEEILWYGDVPSDAEIEAALTERYLDALNYYDHDSVYTSTYITMSYVNGEWQIDAVDDIFVAMLCDYEESWEYAEQLIDEGLDEILEYYENNIIYDDPADVYI